MYKYSKQVDTLLARFGVLSLPVLDDSVSEAVYVIVYAAPRVDIKEISFIRDQLVLKFGKGLLSQVGFEAEKFVNHRMLKKLSVGCPDQVLVNQYLKEIALAYKIKWIDSPPPLSTESLQESVPEKVFSLIIFFSNF